MIPHINGDNEKKEGSFHWKRNFSVKLGGFKPWCLEAFCKRGGNTWKPALSMPTIELVKNKTMAQEEYLLEIEAHKITVAAADERGIIWALVSLTELAHGEKTVECRRISDKPWYGYRGLLLDCVQHFFSIEEIKRVIDEIARVKMNVFHWYLGDGKGFRIESMKYPKLHQASGQPFYTQQEIREIVTYARKRGVEVIPEIDMTEYVRWTLATDSGDSDQAKQTSSVVAAENSTVAFCQESGDIYGFLKELLEEIVSLFDSQWFHIGGNEAPDEEWKNCVCCQSIMKTNHYTSIRQLQEYFLDRVKIILEEFGKKAICWKDAQRPEIFEIDFSYPSEMISTEKIYHAIPAVQGANPAKEVFLGMECCLWTENITEEQSVEEYLFPRIYAFAELAWYGNPDYEAFKERMEVYIRRAKERGIHCCSDSQ